MAHTVPDGDALKEAFKEALAETLHKQRGLLREDFVKELEDCIAFDASGLLVFSNGFGEGKVLELLDELLT